MSPLIFIWLPYDIYINKDNIIARIELVFLNIYMVTSQDSKLGHNLLINSQKGIDNYYSYVLDMQSKNEITLD